IGGPLVLPIIAPPRREGNHVSPPSPLLQGSPSPARRSDRRTREGEGCGKPPGFPRPFPRAGALSKKRSSLHRECQGRAARKLSVDPRLGLPATNGAADTLEVAAKLEHVTGLDEAFEPALVDPREHGQSAPVPR